VALAAGRSIDRLRTWAVTVQARTHHNKAACALADKLARICYAALRDRETYDGTVTRMKKKVARTAYAMPS
jgi:transposase